MQHQRVAKVAIGCCGWWSPQDGLSSIDVLWNGSSSAQQLQQAAQYSSQVACSSLHTFPLAISLSSGASFFDLWDFECCTSPVSLLELFTPHHTPLDFYLNWPHSSNCWLRKCNSDPVSSGWNQSWKAVLIWFYFLAALEWNWDFNALANNWLTSSHTSFHLRGVACNSRRRSSTGLAARVGQRVPEAMKSLFYSCLVVLLLPASQVQCEQY